MKIKSKTKVSIVLFLLVLGAISPFLTAVGQHTDMASTFIPAFEPQSNHNITITNPIPANGTSGHWPFTELGSSYSTYNLIFDLNHSSGKAMNWTI